MKFKKPNLTIFIATHNRDSKLKRVLKFINSDALKTHSRDEIEIVVSDNNSEDNTNHICELMMKNGYLDSYFRNKKNIGPCQNMMTALWRSSGNFIWLLCDDDLPITGAIQEILKIIRDFSGRTGLIYLNNTKEYESGELRRGPIANESECGILSANKIIELVKDELITASSLVINREAFTKECTRKFAYSNRFCGPLALSLDAISMHNNGYLTPKPLIRYIYGDTSEWSDNWYTIWIVNIPMIFQWSARRYGFDISSIDPMKLSNSKAKAFLVLIKTPRFWRIRLGDWLWVVKNIFFRPKNIISILRTLKNGIIQ